MLSSSPFQIIGAFLVFLFGLFIIWGIRTYFKSTLTRSSLVYIWHTLLCLVYFWYVFEKGGDAIGYFIRATLYGYNNKFGFGTAGVDYLTTLLVQGLGLSFLGCFLVFNIFGAIGLLAFDSILRQTTKDSSLRIKRLASLIIFLPSVSFWSSAVGKDSISFMATCLALWAAINFKRHIFLFMFSVLAMVLVRPHIGGIMIAAFALAFIFDKHASIFQRISIGSIAVIATGIAIPFALQYAGLGGAGNTADVQAYIEGRQGYNTEGGGGVDIRSMSLPMQMFTYLFRPLPFEANSVFALAASIDNIILLYLFIIGSRALLKKAKPSLQANRAFLWIYAFMTLIILSMTTANLGIAMRQKWMFAPMFIFLLISVIGSHSMKDKDKL